LDDADKAAQDSESEYSSQLKPNKISHENIGNLKNVPVSGQKDLKCKEYKKSFKYLSKLKQYQKTHKITPMKNRKF
jgi:hypothetical protein